MAKQLAHWGHYVANKWKWTAPADCIIFFDRCSLDYWSFSMTGNIWGGQQSAAPSCGSHFPSEFNAVTGCRYRQNEIDTLKRLSLYVTAMSINTHVPAVKMFTLCSFKCRHSAALCRAASSWMWTSSRKVIGWEGNKSAWLYTETSPRGPGQRQPFKSVSCIHDWNINLWLHNSTQSYSHSKQNYCLQSLSLFGLVDNCQI